jgi:hypothetical protein
MERLADLSLPVSADLVADNAANHRTADSTDRAAAGKDGTADRTDAGTDGRVLVAFRHAGTGTEAEQQCRGQHSKVESA